MKLIHRTLAVTAISLFLAVTSVSNAATPPNFIKVGNTYFVWYQTTKFTVKVVDVAGPYWIKVVYLEGNQNRTGWLNLFQVREIDTAD